MSPDLRRVKEIFDAAAEAGDRVEVVTRLSGGDRALMAEVNSLLALHDAHDLALDAVDDLPRRGRRAPGELLAGRYRVTCFLASGGMGDVYAGVDEETGGKVALKFIGMLAAADPRTESRFRREVDLARRVEHPNVCRVFALTGHERERFCVMELLEGETLAARLERLGPFTVEQALPVALELCDGLAAAHAAGVIHRDLKPGNIFLTPGRAVIIDFGLASAAVPEGSLTSPSAVIGTLAYMAPEQLEGIATTERTDIFALGVVLFEMLVGHKPHAAKSPFRLAAQKARESHRYQGSAAAVPLVWREVIARCLRAKPEKRFASPVGIKRALERGRPSAPFVLGQRRVLVPVLAVLAALTAWLGWKGWRSDYRPAPQAVRLYGEGRK